MNRLEMEKFLNERGWEIETWFSNGTMFVAHRGYSQIIGYPKSNKYRENGKVSDGLLERLSTRKCKAWFSEQIVAKNEYIEKLLQEIG